MCSRYEDEKRSGRLNMVGRLNSFSQPLEQTAANSTRCSSRMRQEKRHSPGIVPGDCLKLKKQEQANQKAAKKLAKKAREISRVAKTPRKALALHDTGDAGVQSATEKGTAGMETLNGIVDFQPHENQQQLVCVEGDFALSNDVSLSGLIQHCCNYVANNNTFMLQNQPVAPKYDIPSSSPGQAAESHKLLDISSCALQTDVMIAAPTDEPPNDFHDFLTGKMLDRDPWILTEMNFVGDEEAQNGAQSEVRHCYAVSLA